MQNFTKQYQQLNQQQKLVVDQIERNILLLAAAGTGKTNTLALRIVNILQKELAEPGQILCLTFTNRACKEMKERIFSLAGSDGLKINVRTFHGFCFDLIKTFAKKTDVSEDFVIYDEEDCREILTEFDFSQMGRVQLQTVQKFIDHIKEQRMIYPDLSNSAIIRHCYKNDYIKLTEVCSERGNLNASQFRFLLQYGGRLIKFYDRTLAERHALDFNDILCKAGEILSQHGYAKSVGSQYKFIHIDEVQDTSLIEYNIIKRIFGRSALMLCGDYFQTIYQWRGSKPRDIFSGFEVQYDPIQVVFDQNYRSTQVLLNASYAFLKTSFPAQVDLIYGKEMTAQASCEGEKILFKAGRSVADEANWIYDQILKLPVGNLSRIAVLCRNNTHNQKLSDAFIKLNMEGEHWIDFLLADQYQFFRSKQIKDILAFLKLIVNKYDDTSLARILLTYARGVKLKTIQQLECKHNRQVGVRLSDFVHAHTIQYSDPYIGLTNGLRSNNVVVFDVESTGTDTSLDEIIQIAAVKIDQNGRVIDQFEQLVIPSKPVGQSESVHHFSDVFLAEHGRDGVSVLTEFSAFIQGTVIVGHNVSFDLTILNSHLDRLNLPCVHILSYYDTLDLARRFYPDLPNHKLDTLSRLFETEVQSSHDAMDDILATKDVLMQIVTHQLIPTAQARKEIYDQYEGRFDQLSYAMTALRRIAQNCSLSELIEQIMRVAHIKQIYQSDPECVKNCSELCIIAQEIEQLSMSRLDAINELIKLSALSANNMDRMLQIKPRVPIITVHQSKGAEFDYVFLAGLQDDMFPSYFSQKSGDLDEERRTFYVAMTRAKKRLFMSCALQVDGRHKKISRFIEDLPKEHLQND